MDPVFANKIATAIHIHCVKLHGQPNTYTQDPAEFRKNVERCFVNVLDAYREVKGGADIFFRDHPLKR